MESFFLLIPLAVLFTALIAKAFFWAVDHRQFDDLDHAARRILLDDEPPAAAAAPVAERHHD
jgi:cbb3-type cytochrome oxidase maturation protein